jgi:oligopeptidase B
MKGRIKEDDSSAPDPDGPYAYYVRYRKGGGQHPLGTFLSHDAPL